MQKYCELKNIHYFCIIFHVSITLNYKNAGIQTPITQIFKNSFFINMRLSFSKVSRFP